MKINDENLIETIQSSAPKISVKQKMRSKVNNLRARVYGDFCKIFKNLVQNDSIFCSSEKEKITTQIFPLVWDDLCSFAERDPAARRNQEYVFSSYTCFRAVMYYRIANALYYHSKNSEGEQVLSLQQIARAISEEAKVKTGVEIHPGAKIGPRFIIDHGSGTVIGETCEIGQDCYLLQGIVLGATGIATNKAGKRHPTLGNQVEVGAFAKILGPVKIGDNVKISPGCIICNDIPSNTRVVVTNEYQIIKTEEFNELDIYAVTLRDNKELYIYGRGLKNAFISIIDSEHNAIPHINIQVIERDDDRLGFQLEIIKNREDLELEDIRIAIQKKNSFITVSNSLAVKRFLKFINNVDQFATAK